jgi:EAL domain-containing protein (putative c-di-GMP-specific phosphodiesterase class I)
MISASGAPARSTKSSQTRPAHLSWCLGRRTPRGAGSRWGVDYGQGHFLALDDFGVGHGTFTYLKHLPVDYLKIDMQFVKDLLADPANGGVVQAIVSIAKQFEIRTIAEGVEDQATLEDLREMGVDYAQGYCIGRPAPIDLAH